MTEQQARQKRLPPEMLAALLQTVRHRQQQGDQIGARVVLRALATQQSDDPRIWLALATVAATRDEQRQAIERAIELDPQNMLALRALERLNTSDARHTFNPLKVRAPDESLLFSPALSVDEATAITPAPVLTPVPEAERALAIRWPLYAVIGVGVALVLIVAAVLRSGPPPTAQTPTTTPALPGTCASALPAAPSVTAARRPTSAAAAAPVATSAPNRTPAPTPGAARPTGTARSTAPPPSPIPPALAPGDIIVRKPWHASLLRPDYAVLLDGAIGSLQPRGRFVLALIAVGNDGATPARIPADLFMLQDSQGNRYPPLSAASTAYLNAYGRGQRGDLSLAEDLPPGGGNVSVPLIFDVPVGARSLTLHIGDEPLGWLIGGAAVVPPTATP
jgi:hypothetical protein